MYEFVRGPLVWIAFIGFFGGLAYQFITMACWPEKTRWSTRSSTSNMAFGPSCTGSAVRRTKHEASSALHGAFLPFHICVMSPPCS